jgi:hypothetical protein
MKYSIEVLVIIKNYNKVRESKGPQASQTIYSIEFILN